MKRTFLKIALLIAPLALNTPGADSQSINLGGPGMAKQYVAYTALPQTLAANHAATLELHFRVLPGYHVNSHTPTESYLIPTELTLPAAAGVKPGTAVYPHGEPYAFSFDPKNKLSVYAGDFIVKVPVTAAAGAHSVDATLRYQACNNASCFPPKNLPVKIDFTSK